jgi:hypothetical protein
MLERAAGCAGRPRICSPWPSRSTLPFDVLREKPSKKFWSDAKRGLLEPLHGCRDVDQSARGRHIQNAERADDSNVAPGGDTAALTFIDEKQRVLHLLHRQSDCGALSFAERRQVRLGRGCSWILNVQPFGRLL